MHQSLQELFQSLSDDELLSHVKRGLSEEAIEIARAELASRNIPLPEDPPPRDVQAEPYLGDFVILERGLTPTEAHMLCACLQTAGIHADAGDTNFVQAYGLLAIAVGGAKVRVPQDQLEEAKKVFAAFKRGDFALGDDFDVGEVKA